MLELLLGLMIFSLAMLPMLTLATRSSATTYSVSKHMMAAQIAQSLLDRFLGLTYEECINTVGILNRRQQKVGDDLASQKVLQETALDARRQDMASDFERAFAGFTWVAEVTEATGAEAGQAALVRVEVAYPVTMDPGGETAPVVVSGLKFKEDL